MDLPFVQIEGHMMISKSSNAQLSDTMDLSRVENHFNDLQIYRNVCAKMLKVRSGCFL